MSRSFRREGISSRMYTKEMHSTEPKAQKSNSNHFSHEELELITSYYERPAGVNKDSLKIR